MGWIKITITQWNKSFAQNHSKDIYFYPFPGWNILSISPGGFILKRAERKLCQGLSKDLSSESMMSELPVGRRDWRELHHSTPHPFSLVSVGFTFLYLLPHLLPNVYQVDLHGVPTECSSEARHVSHFAWLWSYPGKTTGKKNMIKRNHANVFDCDWDWWLRQAQNPPSTPNQQLSGFSDLGVVFFLSVFPLSSPVWVWVWGCHPLSGFIVAEDLL